MAVLDSERTITRLRAAFNHGTPRGGLLKLAADLIRESGPPYTSVYLYMLHGQELILEAASGRDTEHTRIAVGHGVCGTAVATGDDQNVGDVRGRENYIACNLFTRSELVVLIPAWREHSWPDRRGFGPARSIHRGRRGRRPAHRRCARGAALDPRRSRRRTLRQTGAARVPRSSCCTAGRARSTTISSPGFDRLAVGRTLVYYDQRGGGRSPENT